MTQLPGIFRTALNGRRVERPQTDQRRQVLADAGEVRRDWYRIGPVRAEVVGEQAEDGAGSSADVYIYDSIGGWFGVSADDFVRDVAGLDVDHLHVHLNSPGGDAWEGVAIANVLRQHRAEVTVWVDGIAASAASVIAMAGDEVVMGIGAQLMVHDAWTVAIGNAAELRKEAEVADSVSDAVASVYAAKAGGTAAEWRAVMQAERWYTGEQAVEAKLADRVATDDDKGSAGGQQVVPGGRSDLLDWWDSMRSADRHADTVAALYGAPKTPAASASGSSHKERSTPVPFTDEQLTALRTDLGLAADASEDKIVSTVAEVMKEFVKDDGPPPGTSLVSDSVLADLKAKAEMGVEARKQQQAERREQLVQAALRDGRIRPADKESWLNDLEKDPERKEATLAALTPGLIPVDEQGHDQAGAELSGSFNQAEYDAMASALGIPKGAPRG